MEKFVADVHLGKLAKTLRLLGFDTSYKNSLTLDELVKIALEENKILLSRNSMLAKKFPEVRSFFVEAEDPFEQVLKLVDVFKLKETFQPFSRCLICNGELQQVLKDAVLMQLPSNTIKYFNQFWQCNQCQHIYWKGSHYERMMQLIEKIKSAV